MNYFKTYLQNLYSNSVLHNLDNIKSLLPKNRNSKYLDLGCDDGVRTMSWANSIGTKNVFGAEIVPEKVMLSQQKGIFVKEFDLNHKFPFEDSSFDLITSNQVIEHLLDTDLFLSEIFRILAPGGYFIVSTENASSWCNIFASIMGWQIFSLTNFSDRKLGIGNPLALHRDKSINLKSWNHVRILNFRGLKEYLEAWNFKIIEVKGAGYFPLPTSIAKFDTIHSHFITFKVQKLI